VTYRSEGQLSDDLVKNIDGKVPWCVGCQTADFDGHIEVIKGENGKDHRVCPYCGERLGMKTESRINTAIDRPVLFVDLESPRDSVTRLFTSPWGKVRAHISVHSYFAPFVELNGLPCAAIKRVIDEEFSKESIDLLSELGPCAPGSNIFPVSTFLMNLQSIIECAHLDPAAVPEIDYEVYT
jgi:hypothetical protein